MSNSIRVALSGNDALTETNPDLFSLFSDENLVLIKEFERGSITVAGYSSEPINHGLGYIPFFAVYAGGEWVHGYNLFADFKAYATTSTLVFINNSGSSAVFKYYIFYDQMK